MFDLAQPQNNFGSIGWLGDNLTKEFNHNQKVLTDSIQEANTDLGQSYYKLGQYTHANTL